MITGRQIRAGMAILGWSQSKLSEESGVPARSIQRMAAVDGVPNSNALSLKKIRDALEEGNKHVYVHFQGEHQINILSQEQKNTTTSHVALAPLSDDDMVTASDRALKRAQEDGTSFARQILVGRDE